jgi:hypothetical protein
MCETKYAALVCLILGALALFASRGDAAEWKLLELKDATIEYKDFLPGGYRATLNGNGLVDRTLGKEVVLYLNADLFRYFYFNNRVHGGTDQVVGTTRGQFRDVGWNFQLGFRPTKFLSLQYEHHSQHMLDYATPGRFPVEDSIGFQIHFFRDPTPSATVF